MLDLYANQVKVLNILHQQFKIKDAIPMLDRTNNSKLKT